jgi:hypothetical protein
VSHAVAVEPQNRTKQESSQVWSWQLIEHSTYLLAFAFFWMHGRKHWLASSAGAVVLVVVVVVFSAISVTARERRECVFQVGATLSHVGDHRIEIRFDRGASRCAAVAQEDAPVGTALRGSASSDMRGRPRALAARDKASTA